MIEKVNVAEKLDTIKDHWNPRIAGSLNGQLVKLVKFKGEFVMHKHDDEDELFFVIQGEFDMHFEDRIVTIRKDEFIIVPRGVMHKPVAQNEVSVMLFEPASTRNTGDVVNHLTRNELGYV